MYYFKVFLIFTFIVMEVASGEYGTSLDTIANTIQLYNPESTSRSWDESVPVISSFSRSLSKSLDSLGRLVFFIYFVTFGANFAMDFKQRFQ